MPVENLILVISDKPDLERDALAREWEMGGGVVLRLGRFWDPPVLESNRVRPYGADSYCLVLAQKLGLSLISPRDDLIFSVPSKYLGRKISEHVLGEAASFEYPMFVKPLIPKLFRAKVFSDAADLLDECKGLEDDTKVLVSEIVSIEAEARFFLHDNQIQACSIYEGQGELAEAIPLVEDLASTIDLPDTVVIDMGRLESGAWCLIEFNASWGSGLNGCEPKKVMACIAASVQNDIA